MVPKASSPLYSHLGLGSLPELGKKTIIENRANKLIFTLRWGWGLCHKP
jgi:hypothetical protein